MFEAYEFKVTLELKSGMHITGADNNFDIGGADSTVVKNPITKEPYIPGSSLKGKLRSLLEYAYGTPNMKQETYDVEDKAISMLFEPVEGVVPSMTRGIFRDLVLTKESKDLLKQVLGEGIYTEIKAENRINRLKGKAESPRFIERVPAGVKFEGTIVLLKFDNDPIEKMKQYLEEALTKFLPNNFIGGSGSRGYGEVKVTIEKQ